MGNGCVKQFCLLNSMCCKLQSMALSIRQAIRMWYIQMETNNKADNFFRGTRLALKGTQLCLERHARNSSKERNIEAISFLLKYPGIQDQLNTVCMSVKQAIPTPSVLFLLMHAGSVDWTPPLRSRIVPKHASHILYIFHDLLCWWVCPCWGIYIMICWEL